MYRDLQQVDGLMASLSVDSNTEAPQPYFHLRDDYHQVTMQYKEPNFCVLN